MASVRKHQFNKPGFFFARHVRSFFDSPAFQHDGGIVIAATGDELPVFCDASAQGNTGVG